MADLDPTRFVYGPGLPDETQLRLIGDLPGRRILDLGCGSGHNAVALALGGAKVIAVAADEGHAAAARERAVQAELHLEVHVGEPHELAFLRADSIDVAYSIFAIDRTGDLDRVLRQVHRVLRPEAPLLLSVAHPAARLVIDDAGHVDAARVLHRSWFDTSAQRLPPPMLAPVGDAAGSRVEHPRSVAGLFASLTRANFRVDTLLEPDADAATPVPAPAELAGWLPTSLLLRARKTGT